MTPRFNDEPKKTTKEAQVDTTTPRGTCELRFGDDFRSIQSLF